MSFIPHARRAGAVASLAAISVTGLATAASAHVTANPKSAEQGSYAKVAFRVPNERDNASTTKVVVHLPAEHPLSSVSVRPVPGWKVQVEKSKLAEPIETHGGKLTEAVSKITWSGGEIEPGEFEEFDVSMGRLPTDTDRMVFKADQTYSNGEVVKWAEEPPAEGAEEPEHPAPVLRLLPEGGMETAGLAAQQKPAEPAAASADDGTARLLGGVGIAVGVVGIGVGGAGMARARSKA